MVATHSVVPCGHMFCGECLSQWLQKNPSCPKCRAAATGWVQTIAVDNVLESLVEKTMTPDELQERRRKKQNWEANSAQISNRMKNVFRGPAMPRVPVHRAGWQAADMSQAAMQAVAAGVVVPGYGGEVLFRHHMTHTLTHLKFILMSLPLVCMRCSSL